MNSPRKMCVTGTEPMNAAWESTVQAGCPTDGCEDDLSGEIAGEVLLYCKYLDELRFALMNLENRLAPALAPHIDPPKDLPPSPVRVSPLGNQLKELNESLWEYIQRLESIKGRIVL